MKFTKRIKLGILWVAGAIVLIISIITWDRLFPSYSDYNYYLCDAAFAARCLDHLDWSEGQIQAKMEEHKKVWTTSDFKEFRTLISMIQKDERNQQEELIHNGQLSAEAREKLDLIEKRKIYLERVLKILNELGV